MNVRPLVRPVSATLAIVAATIVLLRLAGRRWWCACGSFAPGTFDAYSMHTSQHLLDPYSFSHVIHGVLFYAALRYAFSTMSIARRVTIATGIEAGWEFLENSPLIINRYRHATAALGYEGDSILNSTSDIACMLIGFAIARRLPWPASLAMIVAFELLCLFWIRDNLTLNVVMLIYPIDAIRHWQSGLGK